MGIPKEKLEEVKNQLEKASRPLIFYDDDADGLASFLLAYKFNNQCIGIRVARGPEVSAEYATKVQENMPDLVLILDKPRVEKEFFEEMNTPTYWIDHHDPKTQEPHKWNFPHLTYLNPLLYNKEESHPVAYWMHKITNGPLWIASVGVTSDWDTSLLEITHKELPDLLPEIQGIEHTLYKTPLGVLIRIFNFLQKGRNSTIKKCISTLKHIEEPEELTKKTSARGKFIQKHYHKILEAYMESLIQAKKTPVENDVYCHIFTHMPISFVSDLSNELLTRIDASIIIVGRQEQGRVKFSIRSKTINLQKIMDEALMNIDGYGGGHKEAVGGNINEEQWDTFYKQLLEAKTSI